MVVKMPKECNRIQNGTGIQDMMLVEDSAHGVMCTIHQRVNSIQQIPHHEHKVVHVCPVSTSPSICSHMMLRNKSTKHQSRHDQHALRHRKALCNCDGSDSSDVSKTRNSTELKTKKSSGILKHSGISIEKTNSCPCTPKISATVSFRGASSAKPMEVESKTYIEVRNPQEPPINSRICTEAIVSELKGEIEKVKNQLKSFSVSKIDKERSGDFRSFGNEDEESSKHYIKLKLENKKLKRELELKKKLLESSRSSVEKAKDILNDYEKKVTLLHTQAVKSSQLMKLSKEKFCKCLKDKEDKIKNLTTQNHTLNEDLKERQRTATDLETNFENMRCQFNDKCEQCAELCKRNQTMCECVEQMEDQLKTATGDSEKFKDDLKKVTQQLCDLNCACKKLENKNKKLKFAYEDKVRAFDNNEKELQEKTIILTGKLEDLEQTKDEADGLRMTCEELRQKLLEYEECAEKCQCLEEQCKKQCEDALKNEQLFQKEQDDMRKLVDELTMVVKQNKQTLLQMSEINKQQEKLIQSQSDALMSKEEKLRLVEKESEELRKMSSDLEKEIDDMRKCLNGPCNKDECISRCKELEEIRYALIMERSSHTEKERIIEDQSEAICGLQQEMKEKMQALNEAQLDTNYLEEEIKRVNGELVRKHRELDRELSEKGSLIEKLKVLENQRTQLTNEMSDLELRMDKYINAEYSSPQETKQLTELKEDVDRQKHEWEFQKNILAREKTKAVNAAQFATQKLMETISDFQRQVDAQRKVQIMLTKMLHEKDQQLRMVKLKMTSISNLPKTRAAEAPAGDIAMQELYRHEPRNNEVSNPTTSNSFYSLQSKGSSKKIILRKSPTQQSDLQALYNMITVTGFEDDYPIRDTNR